jgi:hypothetical protein
MISIATGWLRKLSVGLLIAAGSAALGIYVAAHWVERQILTPDNWVALVAPLPKQPVVSTALGSYMSDQLFAALPVKERIAEALPPKASFLASPLADQLQGLTTKASQSLVASDGFQTIWSGANRAAMGRLVAAARGQTPPLQARVNERFDINLGDSKEKIRSALGNAAEAIPALQPAADKAVAVSANLQARPQRVRQVIRTTDFLAASLPFIIVASLLGALALSTRRRRTTMTIMITIATVMLIELIALKWARQQLLEQVQQAGNLSAVSYIFDTLVAWLKQMMYIVLGSALIVLVVCLAAGKAAWARTLQTFLNLDRLQRTRAMAYWRSMRQAAARHEHYLWLAAILLVLISLAAFATISTQTIINAILLALGLAALVHIIATPGSQHDADDRTDGQVADPQPTVTSVTV